jgi:hypothetical protein
MYWLLHVSAVACHHQGASEILLSYLKIRLNGWSIMCGYVACVPDCRGLICCASQLSAYAFSWEAQQTIRHTGHVTTHYMISHPFDLYYK